MSRINRFLTRVGRSVLSGQFAVYVLVAMIVVHVINMGGLAVRAADGEFSLAIPEVLAAEAPHWVGEVTDPIPPPVAITDTEDVAVLRAEVEALTDRVDALCTVQAADHDTILVIQGQNLRVQEQIERLKDRMSAFTVILLRHRHTDDGGGRVAWGPGAAVEKRRLMDARIKPAAIGGLVSLGATERAVLAIVTSASPQAKELTKAEYAAWEKANPAASADMAKTMIEALEAIKIAGAQTFIYVHDKVGPVLSVLVVGEKEKPSETWYELGDTHWPQPNVKPGEVSRG